MTAEANIDVIKKEIEAFNRKDWDAYLACFDPSVVTLEPDEDNPILGHAGLKKRVVTYTNAFPDVLLEVERLFGQDDLVCLASLFIGTHKGELPGPGGTSIAPTGKHVRVHGCSTFRIRKGKITEFIGYYDQVELFNQIGKKTRVT
ncbi:MAG: ester cyclase [Thermoplasmata archaeon]|nr:ester cyclase [Thermoplasmata archaeon]